MNVYDETGEKHDIGQVKIGFRGQTTAERTYSTLPSNFQELPNGYFSVGQDVSYYKAIYKLPVVFREALLTGLKDIVFIPSLIDVISNELVFQTSLLRSLSLSSITGQFSGVLQGRAPLTDFEFRFIRTQSDNTSGIKLDFIVKATSKPSTNIHAIIGRNGVGKTTLFDCMVNTLIKKDGESKFYKTEGFQDVEIDSDYFSSLVSISFSAFDVFTHPQEQNDPIKGMRYSYIGLKTDNGSLKQPTEIREEFVTSLGYCMSQSSKKKMWLTAIENLESDENFANMRLASLVDYPQEILKAKAGKLITKMSSGHVIVLLIITKLVATVEEKTLILFDEPESHLHPPLLSALIRALSELLYDRNGVAIIATHSPVVLQEIPKTNVWKLNRSGVATIPSRPDSETFGQSTGILTREVFGLEVVKSGFHGMLVKSVSQGSTYEEIVDEYGNQLGLEARAVLKVLIMNRDRGME
nr:AAA family ATPase [Desulfovibrio intestinalis]